MRIAQYISVHHAQLRSVSKYANILNVIWPVQMFAYPARNLARTNASTLNAPSSAHNLVIESHVSYLARKYSLANINA